MNEMKRLNCLIIDDEPIARNAIAGYCKEVPFLTTIGLCKNVLQANHYLDTQQIDVIFLDINMPLLSGMEWLKGLKKSPMIIMTTAYEEYALESFKYNVLDYLVKPISFQRFLHAVNKVYQYSRNQAEKEFLFIKTERHVQKIAIDAILFVESMQNYVKVVTSQEQIIVHSTLKNFKEQLPDNFIRTHRSFVVSKTKIDKIKENTILIGTYSIPISTRLKKTVLNYFS